MKNIASLVFLLVLGIGTSLAQDRNMEIISVWDRFEVAFESQNTYENPLYEISEFYALFKSPSGKKVRINGFWDGDADWKIRLMPDEVGSWTYYTSC